jgi:Putative Zn-dependent protease, contains TPR repeats
MIPALYCDGQTARSHPVEIAFLSNGALHLTGSDIDRVIPPFEFHASDTLGQIPRFIRLRAGGVVEVPATPTAFPSRIHEPASRFSRILHALESHSGIAALATLLIIACIVAAVWRGLPALAHHVAFAVPEKIETQAGNAALTVFAQAFPRSQLEYFEQHRVRRQLERLLAARQVHLPPRVVFFSMEMPNAFALPGGVIVVSDELVRLSTHDDEIAAVLAHELGHIEHRHGLQSVLRNSSALLLVGTVTGDLSTIGTFSASLPFLLLQFGYARDFEREADTFAIDLLRSAEIDPGRLADILTALEAARPVSGPDFAYLSTHPSTAERIASLRKITAPEMSADAPR